MRTLLVLAVEMKRDTPVEQRRREANGESPRDSLLEDVLGADVLDSKYLATLLRKCLILRMLKTFLPMIIIQAVAAFMLRRKYDVVVSWDDRFALIYAFLLKIARSKSKHVAILSWVAHPKKARILRFVQSGISHIILWSQMQRDLLIEFSGISSSKITSIPYFVDTAFWRPKPSTTPNSICAIGDSRRDYATLIEAVSGISVQCNIATRVDPFARNSNDWGMTAQSLLSVEMMPENVSIKPASVVELRALYQHAHFVVIPLYNSFRDNGITVVTQAMAMGKAVICSRIQGMVEFVDDGINGIVVPCEDPIEMKRAIAFLLDNPDLAAKMGMEGRRRAETMFSIEQFATNIRYIAEMVAGKQSVQKAMALRIASAG